MIVLLSPFSLLIQKYSFGRVWSKYPPCCFSANESFCFLWNCIHFFPSCLFLFIHMYAGIFLCCSGRPWNPGLNWSFCLSLWRQGPGMYSTLINYPDNFPACLDILLCLLLIFFCIILRQELNISNTYIDLNISSIHL